VLSRIEELELRLLVTGSTGVTWFLGMLDDLADLVRPRVRHPQPHKRPNSSDQRFAAEAPNERWQPDITHYRLADSTDVQSARPRGP